MLRNTFQHLRGITHKRELGFWRSGIISWKDFEKSLNRQMSLFSDNSISGNNSPLKNSRKALANEDVDFFVHSLSSREYFRIASSFPEDTLFLDIETTGLSKYYDSITIIGWSFGKKYNVFIQGDNDVAFRKAMSRAKALVTFNGSLFDIPFIRKEFSNINIPKCHIDLRFLAKRAGITGGQKSVEIVFGVKRPRNILNMRGEAAPLLWYSYRWGDNKALKKLIQYNHADIEGMKIIFDKVVGILLDKYVAPSRIIQSVHRFSKDKSTIKWANGRYSGEGIRLRPFGGKAGPLIALKDLNVFSPPAVFKVVGIDLTGSEERPSGWCSLSNEKADTKRLNTDEQIVRETVSCGPNLVSIDSPLSIPEGRTSVSDDDPTRDTYGIMRFCERQLKRRGVNVYPSLIPSMQKLTSRGIRLAKHFRRLGVPVIESYPGAAQDIIGIPRKRASLEYLAQGLRLFGIKGDFVEKKISHDELDAITSAVVGLFFWSGKFEALGNEAEEYLIIPDLKVNNKTWTGRRIIGLSGPIATGKTTAGKFLESQGFVYGRYSQVLKSLLEKRGIEPNRTTLQKIGNEVSNNPGQRWLCRQLTKLFPEKGNIVIDGLRHPEDHAFMVETFGSAFVHVYIESPESVRMKRYVADGNTKEDFRRAVVHQVEANVSGLSRMAHRVIRNDRDISSFKNQILEIAPYSSVMKQGE